MDPRVRVKFPKSASGWGIYELSMTKEWREGRKYEYEGGVHGFLKTF